MNRNDPNVAGVELMAYALRSLTNELVLVGGCSVGLLITDQARPPVRQTVDVDLVAEVSSKVDYYALGEKLRTCGFSESSDADHMCRWTNGRLLLDVMPSNQEVLGHSTNRWYPHAVSEPQRIRLPSGTEILLISAPNFLATKLEAFHGRGNGDYAHHDMEDIINVIDGRAELVDEVKLASQEVRSYLRAEFDELLSDASFVDGLPMYFNTDIVSQARSGVVLSRLKLLAGL